MFLQKKKINHLLIHIMQGELSDEEKYRGYLLCVDDRGYFINSKNGNTIMMIED